MKLLLTHRFFWPDTAPYASMLRSIGAHLADNGHKVHVFASEPSYRDGLTAPLHEEIDGLSIRRCRVFKAEKGRPLRRALNVLLYCRGLYREILQRSPDIVTVSTFPPVLAAWSAARAARKTGAKLIYHMMDIHPEVSTLHGGRLGKGLLKRLLLRLDNAVLRQASAIVVLSADMAKTIEDRGLGPLPVRIINNFSLERFDGTQAAPQDLARDPGTKRVIFAGNLGRFQNLDRLTEGILQHVDQVDDVELMFLGDGQALPDLKRRWAEHPRVRFAPFLPFEQAETLIADATVGLVSLQEGVLRVAYPSKVMTYLEKGLPILAAVDPESELAKTISDNDLGKVPASFRPDDIAAALKVLLENPPEPTTIRSWSRRHLSKEQALAKWDLMISDLSEKDRAE